MDNLNELFSGSHTGHDCCSLGFFPDFGDKFLDDLQVNIGF
jgi:hypothetical protein